MQEQERQQGPGPRLRRRRVTGQAAGEPDRLARHFFADQPLALGGRVAFVEEQVDRFEHRVEPGGHIGGRRRSKWDVALPQQPLRADESLRDRPLVGEKRPGDFADAEAANDLQRQRHARICGQDRMTGHEHHPELVVVERLRFAGEPRRGWRVAISRSRLDEQDRGTRVDDAFMAQTIECSVTSHAKQPRRRVGGHAAIRPLLQCGDQRILHRLLGQRQMPGADRARQRGDDLRRLPAEQVLEDRRDLSRWRSMVGQAVGSTSRISIEPNSRWGQSSQSRTTSS